MLTFLPTILFFVTAVLYAAVGLGGGSGYLAVLGLVGAQPEIMRPTALALNILVAGIGTVRYVRAGHFSARLFWPLALMSIPFAFLGGRINLPAGIYRHAVGLLLVYSAIRLWVNTRQKALQQTDEVVLPIWVASFAGAVIGLVSGLVGIGGGIFLGPLLLLTTWADTRQAMGVTAAFVLVNSMAGLLGNVSVVQSLPAQLPLWLLVVGAGGWLGAELGSTRLQPVILHRVLAFVLVLAALRMVLN